MTTPYVVYGTNGHTLQPIYFGETMAKSAVQAKNFVRRRKFRYQKEQDTGFSFVAFIRGSQDELLMRTHAQNVPKSLLTPPRPVPSSLA